MQKSNFIKRSLFSILLLIIQFNIQAQTGLNFQGVARTSNNVILASQAITIRLSILQGSATGKADYTETRKVTTNAQGLFTAVIGDTGAISTLGNFTTINWKLSPKFLKIEMDAAAGNNFITMGTTQFQYVAYAQFAKTVDAENIVGIVPVTLGGTGVNSLTGLKTALAIDKINNIADSSKPISKLTQAALDLKLNVSDTSKYVKQTYTDSALLTKLSTTGNATTATSAGTASTATKLTTARNINGVAFDGSGDITVTADAGTLTGTTLKSTVTSSSLTSVGTLANLTVTNAIAGSITGNATTATTAGTSSTATKLATARKINNVGFDGSGDITVTADAGTLTGTTLKSTVTSSSLTSIGTLANLTVTNAIAGSITGNAATATTAGNITATANTTLTSLSSLATVGTITSGVWSGTAVAVAKGGTGLISAGTNGQVLTSIGSGTLTWTGTHYIGESYGGGKVFYVYDNGKHGLIAATSDQSSEIRWYGGSNTNTRARADGVGAGLKNTALIIANQGAFDGNAFAATVCNEYSVTVDGVKYGDWYLPSLNELYLLYLQKSVVGGFANDYYWSSTEYTNNLAWSQDFSIGIQNFLIKYNTFYVRAIRAF
jgi:hypothetical protein